MKIILILIIVTNVFASDISKYDISGIWEIPEEIEGQFSIGEIFFKDDSFHVYAFEYATKENNKLKLRDISNENSNAKDVKGKIFLSNLKFNGEKWIGGRIYDPNTSSIYYARATLSKDKKTLNLRVSFDRFGLVGLNLKWYRIDDCDYNIPDHNNILVVDKLKNEGDYNE